MRNEQVDRREGEREGQRADRITDNTVEEKRASWSGFITPEIESDNVFIHCKQSDDTERLQDGDAVSYDTGKVETPCHHRGQLQTQWNHSYDFEQQREVRSRMCNWIQGSERVNSVGALMSALSKQPVSAVLEANSVLFQCVLAATCSSGVARMTGTRPCVLSRIWH